MQLSFMDGKFERQKNWKLRHEVFGKATHHNRYLSFSANLIDNVNSVLIQGLVDTVVMVSRDQTANRQEIGAYSEPLSTRITKSSWSCGGVGTCA